MSQVTPQHNSATRPRSAAFRAQIEQDKAHREKGNSLAPLKTLWPFIRRYPGWLTLFLVFLFLSSAANLMLPGILKVIIDCGFGGASNTICERAAIGGPGDLDSYFKLAILFMIIFSVLGALRFYYITTLGQRVIADIRKAVYDHLMSLSVTYFELTRTGEILSRLTTDTTLIETVITGSVSFALRAIITILGSIILMFVVSTKLALMVLAIGPVIILPAIYFGRRVKVLSREGQDRLADASARAGEAVSSIQTVQSFTREDKEREIFATTIEHTFATHKKRILLQTLMTTLIFAISLSGITFILWYGARSVTQGTMTGGDIIAFTGYAFFAVSNLGFLTETWTNLLRAAGASERLVDILDTEIDITAPTQPKSFLPHSPDNPPKKENLEKGNIAKGHLAFKNVSFHYPTRPDAAVLEDISFHVAPAEIVAIVGPSGAGKTTLFQLAQRFYDVSDGGVYLDDIHIGELDPQNLRRQFATVAQNTMLFSGSALDNIRYGRPGATHDEIIKAAKAASAHDFIMALPNGYDTDLGERATTLSGGQKQRLAIARAILKDAPIILLDEATSALDSESEKAVQTAFETLAQSRTTLVIAHRLATVRNADKIIVMDKGRIINIGTHDDLMKKDALYKRLANLQFSDKKTPNLS